MKLTKAAQRRLGTLGDVADQTVAPEGADPLLLPPREAPYVLNNVLEKRVYGCRDELILTLGDCFLRFGVDIDTDTITSRFQPLLFRAKKGYASIQSARPWNKYVGKECGWTWLAWNQQGYLDSVLISFDGIEPNVLLHTIGSSIKVFMISPAEKPITPGKDKVGKRNAKAKR
jgi:uncharacterized protein DUF6334